MNKHFLKSKEVWVVIITLLNYAFHTAGLPSVEPTPELLASIIGVVGAIRVLFTKTALSLR